MSKDMNFKHASVRLENRQEQHAKITKGLSETQKKGYKKPGSSNRHKGSSGTPSTRGTR